MASVSAFIKKAQHDACLMIVALFSIGLLLDAAHPPVLLAQGDNPPPQDMPFTLTGPIINHSPGKITVSGGQNMEFDVKYDSKTEIQHQDGSAAKDSEFKDGMEIHVKGLLTEAGDIIARKIVILAKEGSSKP